MLWYISLRVQIHTDFPMNTRFISGFANAGVTAALTVISVLKWLVWLDPLTVLDDLYIEMAGFAGPSHSFEWF